MSLDRGQSCLSTSFAKQLISDSGVESTGFPILLSFLCLCVLVFKGRAVQQGRFVGLSSCCVFVFVVGWGKERKERKSKSKKKQTTTTKDEARREDAMT